MARMSADKADARDYAQTILKLRARRILRRYSQYAEDYISMKHDEIVARGGAFDYQQIGIEAVDHAEQMLAGNIKAGPDNDGLSEAA